MIDRIDLNSIDGAMFAQLDRVLDRCRRMRDLQHWAVLTTSEGSALIPRSELVSRLMAADLPQQARQAARMRLPRTHILFFFVDEARGVRFLTAPASSFERWREEAAE